MADYYNTHMDAGADFSIDVILKTDGVVVDITGATIDAQGRVTRDAAAALWDVDTTGGGIVITDAVNGAFTINVTDTVSAGVTSDHYYDVLITYASGLKERILEGFITLRPAVTR